MRFAYADPPYLGCCKLYDHFHPDGKCWDETYTHELLIKRLVAEFPDGWAMSCSSSSLQTILPLCPSDVRIGAWVKPFVTFKKGVRPCYAWEPLIYWGGRNPSRGYKCEPPVKGGRQTTPKDYVAESITLRKGLTGTKPLGFLVWVLELLNFQTGDAITDLFPGLGLMGNAVQYVKSQEQPDEASPG